MQYLVRGQWQEGEDVTLMQHVLQEPRDRV